jgi:hypothetical protein
MKTILVAVLLVGLCLANAAVWAYYHRPGMTPRVDPQEARIRALEEQVSQQRRWIRHVTGEDQVRPLVQPFGASANDLDAPQYTPADEARIRSALSGGGAYNGN